MRPDQPIWTVRVVPGVSAAAATPTSILNQAVLAREVRQRFVTERDGRPAARGADVRRGVRGDGDGHPAISAAGSAPSSQQACRACLPGAPVTHAGGRTARHCRPAVIDTGRAYRAARCPGCRARTGRRAGAGWLPGTDSRCRRRSASARRTCSRYRPGCRAGSRRPLAHRWPRRAPPRPAARSGPAAGPPRRPRI